MARNYPLFIIDTSRSHGRGREVDYIACTSAQLPWVGEITLLDPEQLAIDYDWTQRNPLCAYSEPNEIGIRAKVKAVQLPECYKQADLRQLLRRALKEWTLRQGITDCDTTAPSDEAVVRFCDVLLGQTAENLRANPRDQQAVMVRALLNTIKDRFSNKLISC